jgi:hypothetical protein
MGLLSGYAADSCDHSAVDGPCIIEEGSEDFLDASGVF